MARTRASSKGKKKKSRSTSATRKHKRVVGSRAMVYHGTAQKTSGGLKKADLMKHNGRIVSKVKHALGKKLYTKYKDVLKKHQFKQGHKVKGRKRRSKST